MIFRLQAEITSTGSPDDAQVTRSSWRQFGWRRAVEVQRPAGALGEIGQWAPERGHSNEGPQVVVGCLCARPPRVDADHQVQPRFRPVVPREIAVVVRAVRAGPDLRHRREKPERRVRIVEHAASRRRCPDRDDVGRALRLWILRVAREQPELEFRNGVAMRLARVNASLRARSIPYARYVCSHSEMYWFPSGLFPIHITLNGLVVGFWASAIVSSHWRFLVVFATR